MSTSYLRGTPLETVYTIFGVNGDKELCARMTSIGLGYTVVVGLFSILQPSPYGRYSKANFGPTVNAKIAWMVQECMSCIFPLILIASTPGIQLGNYSNIVALGLFIFHYFQRSFIYPLTMSAEAKPASIVIMAAASVFTIFNGFLQGHHLTNVYPVEDSLHLFTGIGTIIFITGMAINISHDQILISLRKTSPKRSSSDSARQNTSSRYQIPRGILFEYISGANYFGEIVEWIGFAIITRENPQIVFAIFSSVFLGLRAIHHHRFYKETFGSSYPPSRKAIIPFLL